MQHAFWAKGAISQNSRIPCDETVNGGWLVVIFGSKTDELILENGIKSEN